MTDGECHKEQVDIIKYLDARLDAIEKAAVLSTDMLNVRMDNANEWRATISG